MEINANGVLLESPEKVWRTIVNCSFNALSTQQPVALALPHKMVRKSYAGRQENVSFYDK